MARGRGRPPKSRPSRASPANSLSIGTNFSLDYSVSYNTQDNAIRSPILLCDFLDGALRSSVSASGGSVDVGNGSGVPETVEMAAGTVVSEVPVSMVVVGSSMVTGNNSVVGDAEQPSLGKMGQQGPSWVEVGHIASPIVQYFRKGWFSFRFSSSEAMNSVMREGLWRMGSCSIILKQWSPTFSVEMEKVSVVPVWVLFHGLDPYLWSDMVLSKIASKLGRPLFADKTTTLKSKLSFARVMVEVDVSKPLFTQVYVNSPFVGPFVQEVEYEWVPHYCSGCGKLRHVLEKCKWNKKNVDVEQPVVTAPGPATSVGAPQAGDTGSGSQLLGGTSDPIQASPNPVNRELGSLVQGNGELVSEAVKHSGCTVLGPGSPPQDAPISLVKDSFGKSWSLMFEQELNPLITLNSFDVLNRFCGDILESQEGLICSWNIRGCNDPLKMQEVCSFLRRENLDVFGILETRVKEKKAFKLAGSRFKTFGFLANYEFHRNGRIWVIWNPCTVSVTPLCVQTQYMHCQVNYFSSNSVCQVTFVYADNDSKIRQSLWSDLRVLSSSAQNWLVIGDFNVVRDVSERISNTLPALSDVLELNSCLLSCGLEDMSGSGCDYTWTNNQDGQARVWCKLDRALVSTTWLASFPSSIAHFLPYGVSDHSPVIVNVLNNGRLVNDAWRLPYSGTAMHRFFSHLRNVRGALRGLHRGGFSNIQARVAEARTRLEECQHRLQGNPSDGALHDQERHLRTVYMRFLTVELSMLRQKSKADSIIFNDGLTKFFYARVNERRQAQVIGSIVDHKGGTRNGMSEVANSFIDYYMSLLGSSRPVKDLDFSFIFAGAGISVVDWPSLVGPVLDTKIDAAFASIKPDKSPGPDGFSSAFFTASWNTIKHDFRDCVQEFFRTGRMAKQANITLITLVPKKKVVGSVLDFRPISCCTVMYKVISKILANRLQPFMAGLVGKEQAAFIKGRSIFDNILLSQSLVKSYGRKFLTPRCLVKVDIRKAFDSLQWQFISNMLL
ncbi:hypothetical protein RND81_10G017700 [Saponaria officinalis]|uniref:Reverse transcriptase domain-containing protein n=1 Tax=Saponaria officinalis TaxID=3572 RepID=A0AAW1HXE8_SAPOF